MRNQFVTYIITICIPFIVGAYITFPENETKHVAVDTEIITYYVDSNSGNDQSDGTSISTPWKSINSVNQTKLNPGDTVKFKRGSRYSGTLYVYDSGTSEHAIVLTDYGDKDLPAPAFTNPLFNVEDSIFGNCIRLKGSYIIVENLYFHHTVAELPSDAGGFLIMWELGAIYIDKGAEYCIVRNNEIYDCGVGIKSYGEHAIIEHNYIHDCNRVLKEFTWGPIGIWLGADKQTVRYNTIINYRAVDSRITWGPNSYGGGADGGAIEIDDARFEKTDIRIHHNYTRGNKGFIEVTWSDVKQHPKYENFWIHHNVSDDYQQFIALWRGANCRIENNTIIRRRVHVNNWGVFNITQSDARNSIKNNIIVVENDIVIFNLGRMKRAQPRNVIEHNLYYAASGYLNIGLEGPGLSPVFGDPKFINYEFGERPEDFMIQTGSSAINSGLNLGYKFDFVGTLIPQNDTPDIGAFECK